MRGDQRFTRMRGYLCGCRVYDITVLQEVRAVMNPCYVVKVSEQAQECIVLSIAKAVGMLYEVMVLCIGYEKRFSICLVQNLN